VHRPVVSFAGPYVSDFERAQASMLINLLTDEAVKHVIWFEI
jgi:hypothetical protein